MPYPIPLYCADTVTFQCELLHF